MKLHKKIFLLLATGNNTTNGMANDLNLNNLPYDDNTSLIPISSYDELFTRYEKLQYEYATLEKDQKIMENYLKQWIAFLKIKADGKTCLKNLHEIRLLSKEMKLLQCKYLSEKECQKELDDEMDKLNFNEDPQHIKALKQGYDEMFVWEKLQRYEYIAEYDRKMLPIYKYIGKSNKYTQNIELQRITKLEMKINILKCDISNREYKNCELVVTIYHLEAELPYLENMVKEKQWGLKQIKEYLINESMFTYN